MWNRLLGKNDEIPQKVTDEMRAVLGQLQKRVMALNIAAERFETKASDCENKAKENKNNKRIARRCLNEREIYRSSADRLWKQKDTLLNCILKTVELYELINSQSAFKSFAKNYTEACKSMSTAKIEKELDKVVESFDIVNDVDKVLQEFREESSRTYLNVTEDAQEFTEEDLERELALLETTPPPPQKVATLQKALPPLQKSTSVVVVQKNESKKEEKKKKVAEMA